MVANKSFVKKFSVEIAERIRKSSEQRVQSPILFWEEL